MEDAILISPLEEAMETALVKANVTDAVINALNQKYGELRLRTVDDKEKYIEIKEAAKECAKIRNLAVKCCKVGREDAVAIQKKWVAKEKEVVGRIAEVETPLDAEIERYEANQARIKEEEKKRQEDTYMQRTQALTKMGAEYKEGSFELGEFSIEGNLIKESSAETWETQILPEFDKEFQKIEAVRIENERIEAEKRAKEQKEREEYEKKMAEFKRQQEEFERQQQEAAKKEQERIDARNRSRMELLTQIGLSYDFGEKSFILQDVNVSQVEITTLDDTKWAELIEKIKPVIAERKEAAEKARLAKIEEETRIAAEKAAQAERERIEAEQKRNELLRQQEELRKAEELAKAGDKAIWNHFIEQLSKVQLPTVKSGQYRKIAAIAREKIEEITNLKAN